jgi:hypothetical protein
MKLKNLFSGLLTLILISTLTISCKKDKDDTEDLGTRCETLIQAYTDAAVAFSSEQSVSNCEAYKTALLNYVQGCDASVEASIEQLDCSELGQ